MSRTAKTTLPEHYERFCAYFHTHPVWGSLHVVLDDQNVGDDSVRWCIDYATSQGDIEGAALGEILLLMSQTQRKKIERLVPLTVHHGVPPPWRADSGLATRAVGEVFYLTEHDAEHVFHASGCQEFAFEGWQRMQPDRTLAGPYARREEALRKRP